MMETGGQAVGGLRWRGLVPGIHSWWGLGRRGEGNGWGMLPSQ